MACRAEAGQRSLLRLCRGADGAAALDPGGRGSGRGAYLHRDPSCIELARKRRALERALKAQVGELLWQQLSSIANKEMD